METYANVSFVKVDCRLIRSLVAEKKASSGASETLPLSTLRITALLSMRARYRLTVLLGLMEKVRGRALTWLKLPCLTFC